jgi:hypothetical protein
MIANKLTDKAIKLIENLSTALAAINTEINGGE